MHVITITTTNYVLNTLRLCRSLKKLHPLWHVIVYIDDNKLQSFFLSIGCETKLLLEINELGVKRAKFFAYADAIKIGSFLYLDADIIVLQKLDGLVAGNHLTVCRDRLTECSFIADPSKPWVGRPELSGDFYFNSGVFYSPAHLRCFFEHCLEAAKDDNEWESLIILGKLYDNHFLCAKVAEQNLPINFVSEYQYNWQGFRSGLTLRVIADNDGNLYNIDVNKLLCLVHFAGIVEIDLYIQTLPTYLQTILANAVNDHTVGILECINSQFWRLSDLEDRAKNILPSPIFYNFREIKFKVQVINISERESSAINLSLKLKNNGTVTIPFIGLEKLFFSFHLLDLDDKIIQWDHPRYELPVNLAPEDSFEFNIRIDELSNYDCFIVFDLVKEGFFWWSNLTAQKCPRVDMRTRI